MPIKRDFFDVSGFETENFHCETKKTDNSPQDISTLLDYEPATIQVDEYFLLDCKESLEIGLEFTQEALVEHDASLGRTTFKNKSWAETMEKSMEKTKSCIERIQGLLIKF
jgi:hypothetical protein